jgi:hypothetical protein
MCIRDRAYLAALNKVLVASGAYGPAETASTETITA